METFLKFRDFVGKHRWKLEVKDNNKFGSAFSTILRYYQFLQIIINRYSEISKLFIENTKRLQISIGGKSGRVNKEQAELLEQGDILSTKLHLEIESYYLFAKILLDRVARALESYFGLVRGLALDSHDDLAKRINGYCSRKNLKAPEPLIKIVNELKNGISDFRDYEISHEKSPRTLRGTSYDAEGNTSLTLNVLYPTEKELADKKFQRQSKSLKELMKNLDKYLEIVISFVEENQDKSALKTDEKDMV